MGNSVSKTLQFRWLSNCDAARPWGLLGPGYVLPTVEVISKVRRVARRYLIAGLFLVLTTGLWSVAGCVGFLVLSVAHVMWTTGLLPRLAAVTSSSSITGPFGNQAVRLRLTISLLFESVFLICAMAGGGLSGFTGMKALGIAIAAFFSACAVWCGQLVRMNMRVLSQVRAARGPGYRAS